MEEVRNRCPLRHNVTYSIPESTSSDSVNDSSVQQQQNQQLAVPQLHSTTSVSLSPQPPLSVASTRRQRSWDTLDATAMAQARLPTSRVTQQSPTQVCCNLFNAYSVT